MIVALFAALVVAVVRSQSIVSGECEAQLGASRDCLKSLHEDRKAEMETRHSAAKAEFSACFVDNGCEDPAASLNREDVSACKEAVVRSRVLPALQDCANDRFSFPDDLIEKLSGKGFGHGFGGHHGGGHFRGKRSFGGRGRSSFGGKGFGGPNKLVEKLCGAPNEAVSACLQASFEAKKASFGGPGGFDMDAFRAKFAAEQAKREECKALVTDASCHEEAAAAAEAMCACGKDLGSLPDAESIEAELTACHGDVGAEAKNPWAGRRGPKTPLHGVSKALCFGAGGRGRGGKGRHGGGGRGGRFGGGGGRRFGGQGGARSGQDQGSSRGRFRSQARGGNGGRWGNWGQRGSGN